MTLAWDHSESRGTTRLVLLAIADHDGDGGAWPAMATIARKANCSPRRAQECVRELVKMGELRVHERGGGTLQTPSWERPNRYEITITPVDNSTDTPCENSQDPPAESRGGPPAESRATPLRGLAPEPPMNHPSNQTARGAAADSPEGVDNADGVASLRSALASRPRLANVGGWSDPSVQEEVAALVALHGVARLVEAVADTYRAPRSVRAWLPRWRELVPLPTAVPVVHCWECGLPEQSCRARSAQVRLTDPHEFTPPPEGPTP